jgi:hypothetical protein
MPVAHPASLSQLLVTLFLAAALPACSSTTDPPADQIHVAGTYATAVSLTDNTCTGITVQALPTTVAHTEGSTSLTLMHGPLAHSGTITSAGAFTTAPRTVGDPVGPQSTLSIAGQFSATGFVADVTVTVTSSTAPNCGYKVHWVGTKQGSPNMIP